MAPVGPGAPRRRGGSGGRSLIEAAGTAGCSASAVERQPLSPIAFTADCRRVLPPQERVTRRREFEGFRRSASHPYGDGTSEGLEERNVSVGDDGRLAEEAPVVDPEEPPSAQGCGGALAPPPLHALRRLPRPTFARIAASRTTTGRSRSRCRPALPSRWTECRVCP